MPRNPDKLDYTGGLPMGFHSFEIIQDPRTSGYTRHHFGEVLFICLTGILCGMNGFAEIEHFAKLHQKWSRFRWGNGSRRSSSQRYCQLISS